MKEYVINVPLKSAARNWLNRRAKRNGRAAKREAQEIIESVRRAEAAERSES